MLLMCIFPAYALLTGPYTAKTRIAGVLGSVVGLIANLAQNLLVISTAPTSWPPLLIEMASPFSTLTVNFSGVACVVNVSVAAKYMFRAAMFPAVIGAWAQLVRVRLLTVKASVSWLCSKLKKTNFSALGDCGEGVSRHDDFQRLMHVQP